jgi:hypothetical protein
MNSFRIPSIALSTATAAVLFASPVASQAALTAHYSLDDLSGGLLNLGTDGATSDLSAPSAAATPTIVAGIIGSGALHFDGADILRALAAGNAADDLASYPFSMSLWVSNVIGAAGARSTMFTISQRSAGSTYYGTGVQLVGSILEPELIRRNTSFTELNATGVNVAGSIWTNIFTVFGTAGAEIYVGGKLAGSAVGGQTFSAAVDTIALGGFLRNGSTTTPTDPYNGDLDDVGLFDTALGASDAALVNGFGRLGGIGLEWLDEAQALNGMTLGSSAAIAGLQWEKVGGLTGTTGDFGGTIAGENAYIVTANDGTGLQMIPEPASAALAGAAALALAARRRRRA